MAFLPRTLWFVMKLKSHVITVVFGIVCILVVIFFAIANYHAFWPEVKPPSLDGSWTLTLPAGYTHAIRIDPAGPSRYMINRLVFAGVYKLEGDRLMMVEPRDRRLTEFVWELLPGGDLTLVRGPRPGKTGATYLGARLTRVDR